MAVALPYIMMAGAAISAAGSIQSGIAAKEAGERNAVQMSVVANAKRADAAENARRQRRMGRKIAGTLRNQFVSMDVLEDAERELELEAMSIEHRGNIEALNASDAGAFARYRGKQAQSQSYTTAAGTLLKGAASSYMAGSQMGSFS